MPYPQSDPATGSLVTKKLWYRTLRLVTVAFQSQLDALLTLSIAGRSTNELGQRFLTQQQ